MILTFLVLAVVAGTLGWYTAHDEPAHAAMAWAERQLDSGTRRPLRIWGAALAVAFALAWVWILHPVRSVTNLLSWPGNQPPAPASAPDPVAPARPEPLTGGRAAAKCGPACAEQHTYALSDCALSCADIGGGTADLSWTVGCPDCAAPRDRPCRRSDGTAAAVSCGARWNTWERTRTTT